MTQPSKRLDYIDAAKGIGLLLVIYGHTFRTSMREAYAWCDFSYQFVYRFHVSLLFLLSGMGYALTAQRNHSLSAGQFLRKKAHSLLLPWASYACVIYLLFALAQLLPPIRAMLAGTDYAFLSPQRYLVLLLKNENPYSFHLWYLQTLFLFLAVTFLLEKLLPQRLARPVLLALALLTPGFYFLFCKSWIWAFKAFFQKYYIFLLGVLLPRERFERRAVPLSLLGAACGVFVAVRLFSTQDFKSLLAGLAFAYLDEAAAAGLCLGILAVCFLLRQHLQPLARFGRNTMLFYLYHQPFCCAVLGMILYDKLGLPAVGTVIACMAAGLLVPWCIHKAAGPLRLRPVLQRLGLPE